MSWECIAADGTKWMSAVKRHLKTGEVSLNCWLDRQQFHRWIIPSHLRPHNHINVISATKTVSPAFVSSATIDTATSEQEINKIKNKQNIIY